MITPASTPIARSKLSPRSESPKLPADFTLQFQSEWAQSEVRTVEGFITGFYPKEQVKWQVKICPICKEWEDQIACSCKIERKDSVNLSIHLKSTPASNFTLTATICGPEGMDIISKAGFFSTLNDGQKHKLNLLKIVPYEKTGPGFTNIAFPRIRSKHVKFCAFCAKICAKILLI